MKRGTGTALLPFITHQAHRRALALAQPTVDTGLVPSKEDWKRDKHRERYQQSQENVKRLRQTEITSQNIHLYGRICQIVDTDRVRAAFPSYKLSTLEEHLCFAKTCRERHEAVLLSRSARPEDAELDPKEKPDQEHRGRKCEDSQADQECEISVLGISPDRLQRPY